MRLSRGTLPEEFRAKYASGDYDDAWYQANPAPHRTAGSTFSTDWNAPYWTLFEKKDQGVLYVKADGSVQDYDTVQAFLTDHPEQKYHYLEYYMGGSAALCDVVCTFRVNGAGKLTANQIQANLKTTDSAGGSHAMQMVLDLTITDYGTTTVAPLDVGDG